MRTAFYFVLVFAALFIGLNAWKQSDERKAYCSELLARYASDFNDNSVTGDDLSQEGAHYLAFCK